MNNGNSSKQVLLSVLGIAVLVIAVVGVSFAFFTYSHTGDNQLLTTGSIFFKFTDGDEITLINQFPMKTSVGEALADDDTKKVIKFSIIGHNTSEEAIPFKISAVTGTKPTDLSSLDGTLTSENLGERTALDDVDVRLQFRETSANTSLKTNNFGSTTQNDSEGSATIGSKGTLASGVVIATGEIPGSTKDDITNTYELRMWIDEGVTFGTDADGTKGDNKYSNEEFGQKYYALKVKVDAGDAAA